MSPFSAKFLNLWIFFLVDLSQEDRMICTWDKAEDMGIHSAHQKKIPHFTHLSVFYEIFFSPV